MVFGLEVIFTVLTLINAWASFGTGWGDINTLKFQDWSLVPMAPLSGISKLLPLNSSHLTLRILIRVASTVASIVQFFFAYRIFKLTGRRSMLRWLLPIIICAVRFIAMCFLIFLRPFLKDINASMCYGILCRRHSKSHLTLT